MPDHTFMKLGKKPARLNMKRRLGAQLLLSHLPAPPSAVDNYNGLTSWGMMLNDSLGDCTIASLGHIVQIMSAATGTLETPSDAVVLQAYETFCGYIPSDPNSDQGGYEDDVLRDWQSRGFAGHKLLTFLDIDPKNIQDVKQTIAHFGAVYMGAELPIAAQSQDVWDIIPNDGGDWGGHAMPSGKYDPDFVYFVTWGSVKKATWNWWLKYVDECHVLLVDSWLRHFPNVSTDVLINMMQAIAH